MDAPDRLPGGLCIDHIGIAVVPGSLDAQLLLFKTLGFSEISREDILEPDLVREVLLRAPEGQCAIQLLEPLRPSSPIARQIEKNGGRGGIAHLAFCVADIQKTFDSMKSRGFRLVDQAPRPGSQGTSVFFVHPKTTDHAYLGFVLEIVQHSAKVSG
jgi:methylmalonyl-CoA/ethylmalonyl-CoA epimerase